MRTIAAVTSSGRLSASAALLRRLTLASLVANVAIVVTGGGVRLTGSGLGCPTWPRCTEDSYVTTPEMGILGVIEFGNRVLGIVVGLVALATLVAVLLARPRRRDLRGLTLAVLGLVILQGIIGGISVRVQLNPWVVALHFMLSMVALAVAYALWRRTRAGGPTTHDTVARPLRHLAFVITTVSFGVLVLGTVVTGSGPHAGDATATRTGLDPQTMSQLHADSVALLIGLSVAWWFALRAVGAPATAVRAAGVLIGVELAQGLIGIVQYVTNLPVALVSAHMLGACLVWLATLAALWSTRRRDVDPSTAEPATGEPATGEPATGEAAVGGAPGEGRPLIATS
ncbi:COX15/CtaA family protein [Solwaraspora sp. WMMD406]|uniref:COX15/CtaA family protein n=1 Tax=Solwaraspora sp. WMMD406 TaxID=3016095 RepID=UPI0024161175|nr:COX15/CtaA family protein [Solwaraspora sp. WMMD406]MDG4765540.1 COX15/CtaA family protein [Solwaraspora sp. WMMD406]